MQKCIVQFKYTSTFLLFYLSKSVERCHLVAQNCKTSMLINSIFLILLQEKYQKQTQIILDFCNFLNPCNEMIKITLSDVPTAYRLQAAWQRVRVKTPTKPGVQVSMWLIAPGRRISSLLIRSTKQWGKIKFLKC